MDLSREIKKIVPTKKEREKAQRLTKDLLSAANDLCVSEEPMICGSVSKDTWNSGRGEIDLFILFPQSISKETLKKKGVEYGKKITKKLKGKHTISYAQHPYVRSKIRGWEVDIVPAYKTNPGKIKSAVDRTPHHTKYVLENINNLNNQIRLFKKFCLSIGVYGSDQKTQGLSGYLCELLVMRYGSFEKTIKAISMWIPGEVIDIKGHRERSHGNEILTVIDPVDKKRNVASVISEDNFFLLRKSTQEFLSGKRAFKKVVLPVTKIKSSLKSRDTFLILISLKSPQIIEDILWPQLRKTAKRLNTELKKNGFYPIRYDVWSSKNSYILLEIQERNLPKMGIREGPNIYDEKSTKKFMKAHKGKKMFINDEKMMVEVPRDNTDSVNLLKDFLGKRNLTQLGIPSHIAKTKKFKVEFGDSMLRNVKGNEEFFTMYLRKTINP